MSDSVIRFIDWYDQTILQVHSITGKEISDEQLKALVVKLVGNIRAPEGIISREDHRKMVTSLLQWAVKELETDEQLNHQAPSKTSKGRRRTGRRSRESQESLIRQFSPCIPIPRTGGDRKDDLGEDHRGKAQV